MSTPLPTFPAIDLAQAHRREQVRFRADFLSALIAVWRLLVFGDLRGSLRPFLDAVTPVVLEHRARSATAGARYYNAARALPRPGPPPLSRVEGVTLPQRVERELRRADESARRRREQADPPTTPFRAMPAPAPDRDEVRRRVGGAVVGRAAELRREGVVDLDRLARETLTETSGVASKVVLDGGRQTVEQALETDPEAVAWARITDGDPCAFCAMLASRGFVYKTRETATGAAYHPHCACTAMPGFRDGSTELPELNRDLADLWAKTAGHFTGDNGRPARRAWRRAIDAQRRGQDPVEAAFRDTKGQGRTGGQAAQTDPAPRRRRTRSGPDQATAIRKRIAHMEQTTGQLEARLAAGEDLADLLAFHREELERLRRRAGPMTTPDEALVGA